MEFLACGVRGPLQDIRLPVPGLLSAEVGRKRRRGASQRTSGEHRNEVLPTSPAGVG